MSKSNFWSRIYKDKILLVLMTLIFSLFFILSFWFITNTKFSITNGTNFSKNIKSNFQKVENIKNEVSTNINNIDKNINTRVQNENKVDDNFFYLSKNISIVDKLQQINNIYIEAKKDYDLFLSKKVNIEEKDKKMKSYLSKSLISRDEINALISDTSTRIDNAIKNAKLRSINVENVVKNYCSNLKDCVYYPENNKVNESDKNKALKLENNNDFKSNEFFKLSTKFAMIGSKGYPNIVLFANREEAIKSMQILRDNGDYSKSNKYPYSIAGTKWVRVQNMLIWAPKDSAKLSGIEESFKNDMEEITVKDKGNK